MKIDIEISEASYGKFSAVKLCYSDKNGTTHRIDLNIDFVNLYDYAKDTASSRFDFFLIASVVYGIDNLLNRELFSLDGWSREIEVLFPVKNLAVWQGNETLLSEILKFLTGDYWTVGFNQLNTIHMFIEKKKRWSRNIPSYQKEKISSINLFSGGLDSLIGAIDTLSMLQDGNKTILVSHFDSNSVGPNSDQRTLVQILSKHFSNKFYWIQTTVTLSRREGNNSVKVEDSYRSRSLLFIGIGLYLFNNDVEASKLTIPENGTISLNYPLTPSRSSTLSTRTTHPYFFNLLQKLVNVFLNGIELDNPYSLNTKGEMVVNCLDQKVLLETYFESVSCGKRGHKEQWHIKSGTDHCGVCMPCIYRRAALHKKNIDTQVYGNDIMDVVATNQHTDLPALLDYLKNPKSLETLRRDLIVNGSVPFKQLSDFANVVDKSRKELLKWFSDKGNSFIKNELGLK